MNSLAIAINSLKNNTFNDGRFRLILLSLSVLAGVIWVGSGSTVLILAPLFVLNLFYIIFYMLSKKGLLRLPWSLLLLGLFIKVLSWVALAIVWLFDESVIPSWPFTHTFYYIFGLLSTFILLVYYYFLFSNEEKRLLRQGLIADSTLLFIAIALFVLMAFFDVGAFYVQSFSLDNFPVRVQALLSAYFFFIAFIAMTALRVNLKTKMLLLFSFFPYMLHVVIEAYASVNTIPAKDIDYYYHLSLFFYYLSGIGLIIYIAYAKPEDFEDNNEQKDFSYTGLIWLASCTVLLATPLALWFRYRVAGGGELPVNYIYTSLTIAGIAIFIRFALLITQVKKQQTLLKSEVIIDALTHVFNRRGFVLNLDNTLKSLDNSNYLFCLLDIDTFKSINDTYGHHVGDLVLKKVAKRLSNNANVLLVGRLGGDEFVLILKVVTIPQKTIEALHRYISSYYACDEHKVFVTISIGAVSLDTFDTFEHLYKSADYALYQAKRNYSEAVLFNSDMLRQGEEPKAILEAIRYCLYQRRLLLCYQPIYDASTQKIRYVEVLMRLYDKYNATILPNKFIDIASRHNKLMPLTYLLLERLTDVIQDLPDVNIAINLPPLAFEKEHYRLQLIEAMQGLPKARILLEVTEQPNSNMGLLRQGVMELQTMGYKIALDDFGAGSSSLSRLAWLSVDVVKIDISLLRAAERGRVELIESAVELSHRLGAEVIVEGVEKEAQFSIARSIHADMVQGFYFSQPLTLKQLNKHTEDNDGRTSKSQSNE